MFHFLPSQAMSPPLATLGAGLSVENLFLLWRQELCRTLRTGGWKEEKKSGLPAQRRDSKTSLLTQHCRKGLCMRQAQLFSGLKGLAELVRVSDEAAHRSACWLLYTCCAICNLTSLDLFYYYTLQSLMVACFSFAIRIPPWFHDGELRLWGRVLNTPSNYTDRKGSERLLCFLSVWWQEHHPSSPNFLITYISAHPSVVGCCLKYPGTEPKAGPSKADWLWSVTECKDKPKEELRARLFPRAGTLFLSCQI